MTVAPRMDTAVYMFVPSRMVCDGANPLNKSRTLTGGIMANWTQKQITTPITRTATAYSNSLTNFKEEPGL